MNYGCASYNLSGRAARDLVRANQWRGTRRLNRFNKRTGVGLNKLKGLGQRGIFRFNDSSTIDLRRLKENETSRQYNTRMAARLICFLPYLTIHAAPITTWCRDHRHSR